MDGLANPSRRRFLTLRPAAAGDGFVARPGDGCLPFLGTDCQICRDACPAGAIRFVPRRGGPFLPSVEASSCTGCGDCVGACPTAAMALGAAAERADG